MKQAWCPANAHDGRIELIIEKGEDGYDQFALALNKIDKIGCMSWYGDVIDKNGVARCGLIITCKPE